MISDLVIDTADGGFHAYVATPAATPAPAVVVIQEIFGVNAGMRQIADELARNGFLAVVPDIFWRLEPGLQLSDHDAADMDKALSLYGRYDVDHGVKDIAAAISTVRGLPECTGKVGVTGFCLGGLMTFLTASRADPDGAVAFYGGRTDEFVGEAGHVKAPLLIQLAGADGFIDAAAQAKIAEGVKGNGKIEVAVYPGRDHAFVRPGGDSYDEADAAAAMARATSFLKSALA